MKKILFVLLTNLFCVSHFAFADADVLQISAYVKSSVGPSTDALNRYDTSVVTLKNHLDIHYRIVENSRGFLLSLFVDSKEIEVSTVISEEQLKQCSQTGSLLSLKYPVEYFGETIIAGQTVGESQLQLSTIWIECK